MSRKRRVTGESWDAAPQQPFVSVLKPTLKEPAWLHMSFGARCLYITLKSYFNGQNNGRIYLGVRKAALELGASRSSTERWFKELQEHGFIRPTQGAFLGSEGKASATYWRITEVGCMGERPTREFKDWKPGAENKTPHLKSGQTVTKIGTGRHENRDNCPENGDALTGFEPAECPDNRVIGNIPSIDGVPTAQPPVSEPYPAVGPDPVTASLMRAAAFAGGR